MKRSSVYLSTLAVLAVLAAGVVLWCRRESVHWAPYVPLVWSADADDLVEKPEMLTRTHAGAMAVVCAHYGEPFRFDPGPPVRFYVSSELAANDELIYNFTKKAQNLVRSGTLDHIGAPQ